jgi:hypothetical protein
MRHHFGDFLDRESGHWNMTPNRARYGQDPERFADGDPAVTAATIGKDTADWRRIATFPNLVELTLHEPSATQLEAVG